MWFAHESCSMKKTEGEERASQNQMTAGFYCPAMKFGFLARSWESGKASEPRIDRRRHVLWEDDSSLGAEDGWFWADT